MAVLGWLLGRERAHGPGVSPVIATGAVTSTVVPLCRSDVLRGHDILRQGSMDKVEGDALVVLGLDLVRGGGITGVVEGNRLEIDTEDKRARRPRLRISVVAQPVRRRRGGHDSSRLLEGAPVRMLQYVDDLAHGRRRRRLAEVDPAPPAIEDGLSNGTSDVALLHITAENFANNDGAERLGSVLGVSRCAADRILRSLETPGMNRLAPHYGYRPDERL